MISLRKGASAATLAMALLVGACSDDTSGEPLSPGKLSVVGDASATGPAGFPLPAPFKVQLTTKGGTTLSGRVVHFTASNGAVLSADSSYTDENGIASVGVTVGPVGNYTVTASVPNVAPVTFSATARAAIPSGFFYGSGTNQIGFRGEEIGPVSVFVVDQSGVPAVGVPVNFTVTNGGGSVTTPVLTDTTGLAVATWTLGVVDPATAPQTLSASYAGFTPINFAATFVADPCTAARPVTIPFNRNRALDSTDCLKNGKYMENFDFSYTTPVLLTQTSSAFNPSLVVLKGTDTAAVFTGTGTTASYKAYLAAGTTRIVGTSGAAAATGAYTLSAAGATEVTGCERAWIMKGATSGPQNIGSTDCQLTFIDEAGRPAALHYGDEYYIYVKSGTSLSIVMTGSADNLIRLLNAAGTELLQRDAAGGGGTETMAVTVNTAGIYRIHATHWTPTVGTPTTGTYTLTIN
jgi:hypothetical protein